jgi:hypothetical protein
MKTPEVAIRDLPPNPPLPMFTRQEERGKNLYSTAVWGRDEIIPRLSINIWE